MAGRVRVLTLNCWNISAPFEERIAGMRAVIEALEPDLIGLQEIIVRDDGFDQATLVLQGLGYAHVFGAAFRWDGRNPLLPHSHHGGDAFGNVIAARWPITKYENRALPGAESGERRSILAALVASPMGMLPILTTHLNWKFHHGYVRERQAIAAASFADEWSTGLAHPPMLIGDFNADPDASEIRYLCGLTSLGGGSTYFQDAWRVAGDGSPGYTWDNRNPFAALNCEPNRRIDYIFVGLPDLSGCGIIESVRLAFTEGIGGVFPSDHFGLVADVRT